MQTVEGWTGVNVNHVMQISFSDFPGLIDAMGGITYKGSCVISKINGGYKNGGVTLRIRSGERVRLNGKQALALARTRKNACNRRESDLTRAHRQQKVLSAMKRRALSPIGFVRMPLIAWEAPKTMDSDMAGPLLIGTMLGMAIPGGGTTQVLGTESGYVPDAVKQERSRRSSASSGLGASAGGRRWRAARGQCGAPQAGGEPRAAPSRPAGPAMKCSRLAR